MNGGKVRTIHRRLGISIACFLLVQAIAGMLMSIGRLASVDTSKPYSVLYSIHADWDPLGSIYRAILGLATAGQGALGIMIFLDRKKKKETPFRLSGQPDELEKEIPIRALSFSADIRPLFRPRDIESMKPLGIDLSSYEDVKKHAPNIYARLSAKEMPCDEPWSDSQMQKFKEWMQSRMEL
ncbi:MAG: hypothetical protein ABSF48_14265 [Thermodesulfobacteriota bacterium]|jgi:succinate dehydrogenase/fumarate reductase cytochrome b subunit